ncbi:hypothetical protein GIB67_035363 [Kingdonia uniflora]|uniref:Uncharacterized protein n=1 Tax=Kingdonia uniflora TaxID=39325 RepID=A0A7J7MM99_9MAGN|nr:hypothetical protein GIB67_035363 [Kingdonia uniflora]
MVSTRDRLKQTKEKLVSPLTINRKLNSKKNDLEMGNFDDQLTILEITVSDLTSIIGELVEQLHLTKLAKASASATRRGRSRKKDVMEVDGDDDFAEIDSGSSDAESDKERSDYAIFINMAQEFDSSDSGARPDEAVSWEKKKRICRDCQSSLWCDYCFPLVEATFAKNVNKLTTTEM